MTSPSQSPYTDDWKDWLRPFGLDRLATFLRSNRIVLIATLFVAAIMAFPARPVARAIFFSSVRPLLPNARFARLPATTSKTFQVIPGGDYELQDGAIPYPAIDPEGILIPVMDTQPRTSARILVLWDAEADRARFRVDLHSSHFAVGGAPPPMAYNRATQELIFSLWSYPGLTGRPLIDTELVRVNAETGEVTGHTIIPGIFQVQDIDPSGTRVLGLRSPWYARIADVPWDRVPLRRPGITTYPVSFVLRTETLEPHAVLATAARFLGDNQLLLGFWDTQFVYDIRKGRRVRDESSFALQAGGLAPAGTEGDARP